MKIRYMDRPHFQVETISLLYYKGSPLENAVEQLFVTADRAYRKGANILILSDRGVDENHMAIPSLLAVSALQKHLIRTKKRTAVSLILESGQPRDVHHFAALLGYGATAINPYLAQDCVEELVSIGLLDKDPGVAVEDYNSAVLHGVVKIASKMRVSTIQSYQSAQIFECVGIHPDLVDRYFTNPVSRVGGIGLEEIGQGVVYNHDQAFDPLDLGQDATLNSTRAHKLRSGAGAEDHMYSPQTILLLQKAAREGNYGVFKEYSALVDFADKPHTLRGLLDFRFAPDGGIPIDEVEPVESIVRRFGVGAMSYGAISREAHECLAVAMNRIGGKFNCGVPLCQAGIIWEGAPFGCPLHNLIPEWNDMIMAGNWSHALARLLKTNNFPEFTGRVCPALCEQACLCRMYEDSVTIRDNELCVIEKGFELGKVKPRIPPRWTAHLRYPQHEAAQGNRPAADRPDGGRGVTFVTGTDASDPKLAKQMLREYDAIVLCCGAGRPRPLALDTQGVSGVCYGTEYLKASIQRQQFGLKPDIPSTAGRDVVIVGTGDTASDCVATALRQGCASVIQLVRRKRKDYLDEAGNLPSDYAQIEALAILGRDPRRFGVQIQELVKG